MSRNEVEVTHADRLVFPADGITKGDIVDYYSQIADVMVSHLKGRPLTVWRYPRGIDHHGFVQQDFSESLPEWMGRVEVDKEGGTVVHPTADRPQALRWLANQNCLTLHAWMSRRKALNTPDQVVFDLDPSGGDFAVVRATARAVADVLDELGLAAYLQTTGSRGIHVVTPIKGDADFDTVRQFARDVAEVVVLDDPAHRTVEMRKANRGDRVYLDVMRNAYAQTAVAPYAVRAKPGAPVATPLAWKELSDPDLSPVRWTLRDVPKRLAERGDPWAGIAKAAASLPR